MVLVAVDKLIQKPRKKTKEAVIGKPNVKIHMCKSTRSNKCTHAELADIGYKTNAKLTKLKF